MKLRSFLTISGVVIGIAAFVSMMSYGAGIQKYVAKRFKALELFNTLQVIKFSADSKEIPDSGLVRSLDAAALKEISAIPGVLYAYPEETFPVVVEFGEESVNTTAQSLPAEVSELAAFKDLFAGRFFQSDSANEVVIHRSLMENLGVTKPDSIIGREITVISVKLDIHEVISGFLSGRLPTPSLAERRLKFIVCGVTNIEMDLGFTLKRIIIPAQTAKSIEKLNFANPFELIKIIQGRHEEGYPNITVRIKSAEYYENVKESIQAMGFDTWSFSEQFDEIRKMLYIFDAMMAVVGCIALIVASLGIVNTLMMSIIERQREIGILKSLGADNGHIRLLFIVEASVIGFIGSVFGVLLGWIITRIGWTLGKYIMERKGIPLIEFFDLPFWLIALSIAFGISVSLLAGLYPSQRAAKIDPVKALRYD